MRLTKINREMRRLKITKTSVADKLGVSWQMVYRVCRGKTTSARVRAALEAEIAARQGDSGTA